MVKSGCYSLLTAQCRPVGPCAGRTAAVCDGPSPRLSSATILLEEQITGTNGDIRSQAYASFPNYSPVSIGGASLYMFINSGMS